MADSSTCATPYTVRRGDSFYLIAQRFNVSLRDLLAANANISPSRLKVGDVLCIPNADVLTPANEETQTPAAPEQETQTPDPEVTPEVTPEGTDAVPDDDVLDNQTEQEELCPPSRRAVMQQGQTASDLQLKYDLSYHTLSLANEDKDLEALSGGDVVCVPTFNVPCALPDEVIIGSDETLDSLALTFNLPIAALLRANPCLSPGDFVPGAHIKLPK